MKRIVILVILSQIIVGCGKEDLFNLVGYRKFKVGDCVAIGADADAEAWDKPDYIILKLGKHAYRTHYIFGNEETDIMDSISYGYLMEGIFHKVPCGKVKKR